MVSAKIVCLPGGFVLCASLCFFSPPAVRAQPAKAAARPATPSPVGVQVQLEYYPAAQKDAQPLSPGRALSPGDEYTLRVSVEKSAYVTVFVIDAVGEQTVLYPPKDKGEQRIEPGSPVVLPAAPARFKVDQDLGEENIFVVASAAPLSQSDPALHYEATTGRPLPPTEKPTTPIKLNEQSGTQQPSSQGTRPPPEPIRTTERSPNQLREFIAALGRRAKEHRVGATNEPSRETALAKTGEIAIARILLRVNAPRKKP